jgi:hypothetical protein
VHPDAQQATDEVAHVAERAGGAAIAQEDDRLLPERGPHEVRDDPLVVEALARAVDVEGPHHAHGHVVEAMIERAERLAEALRLVVAGARAGERDAAGIVLGGRDRLRRGVAIDLARAEMEESAHRLRPRQLQHPARPADVGVDRLEGMPPVERRRGDAGAVQHPGHGRVRGERRRHVVPDPVDPRRAVEVAHALGEAGPEGVEREDAARPSRARVVGGQDVEQVGEEKARRSGDEDRRVGERGELVAHLVGDERGVLANGGRDGRHHEGFGSRRSQMRTGSARQTVGGGPLGPSNTSRHAFGSSSRSSGMQSMQP